jgi:hypothetical protein
MFFLFGETTLLCCVFYCGKLLWLRPTYSPFWGVAYLPFWCVAEAYCKRQQFSFGTALSAYKVFPAYLGNMLGYIWI